MQQYNYVIFQTSSDYYRISYSDLKNQRNVMYIDSLRPKNSKIKKTLYRIHHSKKINSILELPAKKIWYPSYFINPFKDNLPICFIFNARWMQYPYLQDYVLYLKYIYNAKFVCFYQDLVDTHPGAEPDKVINLFDLVLSYDKIDAEKYGLVYHPTVYSNYKVDYDLNIPESDLYFVGLAKDRLDQILEIFYQCKEQGVVCDFYLSGVPPHRQIKEDGLNYIDKMSYIENLKHVLRTKCILEILQGNAKGSTVRTWEAIMYDKKILTNNFSVIEDFYFDRNYIRLLEDDNINKKFIKDESSYINPYKKHISPNRLLDFITDRL